MPTDSLISRTNQKNNIATSYATPKSPDSQPYAALPQRYTLEGSSESESDDESGSLANANRVASNPQARRLVHPSPLRSHPPPEATTPPAKRVPLLSSEKLEKGPLPRMDDNRGRVGLGRNTTSWRRQRISSIQLDDDFYSMPYSELRSRESPVMVGCSRKVSTGNDFDLKHSSTARGRRIVSGREAEEGLAVGYKPQ